jgi:hypothetical protein
MKISSSQLFEFRVELSWDVAQPPVKRLLREHLVGSGRGAATSGAVASGAHKAARGNGAQTSEARPLFS